MALSAGDEMDLAVLVEVYGPLGIIIIGLVGALKSERAERKQAQQDRFDTLAQVIPAVAALQEALRHIKRGENQ
jgi:hypothetical protein